MSEFPSENVADDEDVTPAMKRFLVRKFREFGKAGSPDDTEDQMIARIESEMATWPEVERDSWALFMRCVENPTTLTRISPDVAEILRAVMRELGIRPMHADGQHRTKGKRVRR